MLNRTPTVLAVPDLVPTVMTVAVGGVAESQYAYVVGGSLFATRGQTVTVYGETTVLAAPTRLTILDGGAAGGWDASWNVVCVFVGTFLVLLF
jgi:hypothetical protein